MLFVADYILDMNTLVFFRKRNCNKFACTTLECGRRRRKCKSRLKSSGSSSARADALDAAFGIRLGMGGASLASFLQKHL